MTAPRFITVAEAIAHHQSGKMTVVDVRSPKEFEAGHIPSAINIPLLNNEHRHLVGCCYKEQGQAAAVGLGYQLVTPLFPQIQAAATDQAQGKTIVLHCWRGGLRSKITAGLLAEVGFEVLMVEGGYKAWRNQWIAMFSAPFKMLMVGGLTGSGKTELLMQLQEEGLAVVDLEGMAHHRGSAFGGLGLPEQPTQEQFENVLGCFLYQHEMSQCLLVESESRMIGRNRVPDHFFNQMWLSPRVEVVRTLAQRTAHILSVYGVFPSEDLIAKTEQLKKRMGSEQVKEAVTALEEGNRERWVELLLHYYDKNYQHHSGLQEQQMIIRLPHEENWTMNQWAQAIKELCKTFN
jgi:tRNA 2-selenouridine synthase